MVEKQEHNDELLERQRAKLRAGQYVHLDGIDAAELERLQKRREEVEAREQVAEKRRQVQEAEQQARLDALRQAEAEKKALKAEAQARREAEAREKQQEKATQRAEKAAEVARLRRRLLDLRTERTQAAAALHGAQVELGRVRGLGGDGEVLDAARDNVKQAESELAEIEAAIDAVAAELAAANPGAQVGGHRVVQMRGAGRR